MSDTNKFTSWLLIKEIRTDHHKFETAVAHQCSVKKLHHNHLTGECHTNTDQLAGLRGPTIRCYLSAYWILLPAKSKDIMGEDSQRSSREKAWVTLSLYYLWISVKSPQRPSLDLPYT